MRNPSSDMSFGEALRALKQGQAVQRRGWNGKNMFVYLVPANAYAATSRVAKERFGEAALVPYDAYLALKTVEGRIVPWTISTSDALAEDWQLAA